MAKFEQRPMQLIADRQFIKTAMQSYAQSVKFGSTTKADRARMQQALALARKHNVVLSEKAIAMIQDWGFSL